MFMHNKKLMYTVRVAEPNPTLASLMLEQFGGPQGELAAAMRYFTQAISDDDPKRKDMLFDIATEEMSHLEIIGNIIVMLNKGVHGKMAEGLEEGTLLSEITQGGESHTTSLLYGGGAALINSAGVPFQGSYVDTIGEPTADLRSNIAAEARAKIIYERLINVTNDPGVKDALGFLMTREIAHQKSFEAALDAIPANFPVGKLPGDPDFTNKYYNLSTGEESARGPWNQGKTWEFVDKLDQMTPAGTGDGRASVMVSREEEELLKAAARRTASQVSKGVH
jgi:Mn-containing catalase